MCIEAGMNDYVPKPISPQALLAALEKWLPPEPVDKTATTSAVPDGTTQVSAELLLAGRGS
jgi:DNA-binding response OmpR family regulator